MLIWKPCLEASSSWMTFKRLHLMTSLIKVLIFLMIHWRESLSERRLVKLYNKKSEILEEVDEDELSCIKFAMVLPKTILCFSVKSVLV